VIEADSLCLRYPGGRDALTDLSFRIDAGEMVFVTGRSGAGKSTLVKLIASLLMPSRGTLRVLDCEPARLRRRQRPQLRRRIGTVFQDHRLLPGLDVAGNVALPLRVLGASDAEVSKRVRAALDLVGLASRANSSPSALSGGEQQRVGIARAIVHRPALLLADEPTGNLDPQLSVEIMNLFERLGSHGTTVLIASHDLHLIRQMRKRVLVLDGGRLLEDFRPPTPTPAAPAAVHAAGIGTGEASAATAVAPPLPQAPLP
jgi:cell division transport system ATP-binding protein